MSNFAQILKKHWTKATNSIMIIGSNPLFYFYQKEVQTMQQMDGATMAAMLKSLNSKLHRDDDRRRLYRLM